ncbi:hypothetical protein D6C87_05507 [Aureobasidium pullulans]|uniref:Uncharacterized protein n=1 Tax=Aureobasidium pullulans TaxID=5580 RepID=A0AB38M8Y8_AURPU|nr:hypothetical protein D6C94_00940 [Aureobasidium pullulans]THZ41773.1 hypothetical protein D6C87_05507 [Aureobasidium pullulans]
MVHSAIKCVYIDLAGHLGTYHTLTHLYLAISAVGALAGIKFVRGPFAFLSPRPGTQRICALAGLGCALGTISTTDILDTTGYRKSLSKRSGLEKYGICAAVSDEKKMNAGKSLEMISLEHKISELERRFEKKAREMAEIRLVELRMDKLESKLASW